MNRFLEIFFTKTFPQFRQNQLHFAGNSYAGHFIPGMVADISRRQREGVPRTAPKPFDSIILFNGVLYYAATFDGSIYDHFCSPDSHVRFNSTACEAIASLLPECERLQAQCLATYDENICRTSTEFCQSMREPWYKSDVGEVSADDDRAICEDTFACGYMNTAFIDYLNLPDVQQAILGPDSPRVDFWPFNESVNAVWEKTGAAHLPTTRQLSYILDETDVSVLMVNGNNDVLV